MITVISEIIFLFFCLYIDNQMVSNPGLDLYHVIQYVMTWVSTKGGILIFGTRGLNAV